MKKAIAICGLLLLTACEPTYEQQVRVRQQLPAGCSVRDLGQWGDISHLIVVDCGSRATRTMSYPQQQGKYRAPIAVVQID